MLSPLFLDFRDLLDLEVVYEYFLFLIAPQLRVVLVEGPSVSQIKVALGVAAEDPLVTLVARWLWFHCIDFSLTMAKILRLFQ